jgi:hypothetical protein
VHIDISSYERAKRSIIMWFDTKGGKDVLYTLPIMAQANQVPCIVIAYWLGEHTQWQDPECAEAIERLTKFYGYTKITGKPEGSPI